MNIFTKATAITAVAIAGLSAGSAMASTIDFTASLTGDQEVNADGTSAGVVTDAFGSARISVDTDAETISFYLSVTGLTIDSLFDDLVAAAVGPIHLHNAPAGANGPIDVPFAFSEDTYSDTETGFAVNVEGFRFADAVALAGSEQTFEGFLAELSAGNYYINVHSDTFTAGELRGQVAPVPLPAGMILLLTGLGALGAAKRRRRAA